MLQTCTNRDGTFKKVQKTNILKADGDTAISDIIFSDKDQVSQMYQKTALWNNTKHLYEIISIISYIMSLNVQILSLQVLNILLMSYKHLALSFLNTVILLTQEKRNNNKTKSL